MKKMILIVTIILWSFTYIASAEAEVEAETINLEEVHITTQYDYQSYSPLNNILDLNDILKLVDLNGDRVLLESFKEDTGRISFYLNDVLLEEVELKESKYDIGDLYKGLHQAHIQIPEYGIDKWIYFSNEFDLYAGLVQYVTDEISYGAVTISTEEDQYILLDESAANIIKLAVEAEKVNKVDITRDLIDFDVSKILMTKEFLEEIISLEILDLTVYSTAGNISFDLESLKSLSDNKADIEIQTEYILYEYFDGRSEMEKEVNYSSLDFLVDGQSIPYPSEIWFKSYYTKKYSRIKYNEALDNEVIVKAYFDDVYMFIPLNRKSRFTYKNEKNIIMDIEGHWAKEEIIFASNKGLIDLEENKFKPDDFMSRGHIVMALYRLEGQPEVSINKFSDVSETDVYYKAIVWANENNIVNGINESLFNPRGDVTREQFAAILYRYMEHLGKPVFQSSTDLQYYSDYNLLSPWGKMPSIYAFNKGLITGRTTTTFNPGGHVTNGEVATILLRLLKLLGE